MPTLAKENEKRSSNNSIELTTVDKALILRGLKYVQSLSIVGNEDVDNLINKVRKL